MNFDLKNRTILGIVLVLTLSLSLFLVNSVNADTESPKKQYKRGIPAEDITCKTGLNLVIRTNGFAACVKSTTADKLEKMGLVTKIIKLEKYVPKDSEKYIPVNNSEEISIVPASTGSIVNFYITDDDLNLAHNGVETVSTEGLFEFSINGISIDGPSSMIETGPDTGRFYVKLELPDTINGIPLDQNDVVLIKYLDASDYSGNEQVITKSIPLTNSYAKVETSGGGSRIGHEFTVRIYEPDANLDSKDEDKISLSQFEYRGEGGIRTTLANPSFDANSAYMIETGPNTSTFEVKIEIPRRLDGKVVDIGDWYEIRYIDSSTPSGTDEKIVLKGKIG
ncbi:MAG: hypothetical protein HOO66_02460 [Nitrosarchaeum sp.]|nr:hypothetical protein [Nitrosarchaeum sp.]